MSIYWKPHTKWELVNALALRWPVGRAQFKRMKISQLYAVYYKLREKDLTNVKL